MENKVLRIENAKILFRNFSGRQTEFNPQGLRTFSVIIDDETAEVLRNDGWNVKYNQAKDVNHIEIKVSYQYFSPQIYVITGKKRTALNENTVHTLDNLNIESVDLEVKPSTWVFGKKTGVKAYLNTLYVMVSESYFDKKYSDLPLE